jgi:DNA-binding ferritin-like protein
MWQIKTDEGHFGSVVVGRIDSMERLANGIGNAEGVFDNGEYGREAERLVRGGFIRGISADLDKFEADEDPENASNEGKGQSKILISKARVMGVTLVPKPAFQECTIELVEELTEMNLSNQEALVACAAIAASIPVVPPKGWFENPKLAGPTPLTVSDDGRVFGHIAAWHIDHIGLAFGTKPPRSKSNYAYFHTGVVRTQEGSDIPVGQLTLAGGHASLNADARAAAKHYDDTGSAFADVHAGEDSYGIWVSGALRPSVTPEQVRAIRASAPSGDWRPIGGALELVAVCQVNVPGFPIARARVASGQMYALVAAGASYLARLKDEPEILLAAADDAKARFAAIKSELGLTAGAGCGCCVACMSTCDGSCCPNCKMGNTSVEKFYIEPLKKLLADIVGFYFRSHGYHWNVMGEDFAQYHELFGEIYADVYGSIDPLAENIRKVGAFPQVSLKSFAEDSSLADSMLEGGSPKALAADLLMANEALVEELKETFTMLDAANEQGLADFIAGRIDAHQKWSWQLASSLTPDDIILVENQNPAHSFEAVFASLAREGLIASAGEDFAYIPESVREKAAEKGQALPDGSYPIRNVKDLKNAIQAYGRSKPAKRAAVRNHIMKRAKALGRADLIPDTFKDTATIEATELSAIKADLTTRVHGKEFWVDKAAELSARMKSLTAAVESDVIDVALVDEAEKSGDARPKFTAETQPRDAQGRFRTVLARLKQDLGAASLHSVAERVKDVENLDNTGNYAAAAAGARDVIDVVNRIDTEALDSKALSSVRLGASALAKAISNLPLPFQDQAQKVRYSDIPPALRDLMDDMITKVEAKIGSDDAKIATEKLMAFKSGSEVFSQSEISSEMNKLLRLLT